MPARVKYDDKLMDKVERGMTKAKLRAAKKLRTKVLKDQKARIKQKFPGAGNRRTGAVKAYISPHGSHINFKDSSPGAEAHEEGATIRPKNGKFLAVHGKWGWHGADDGEHGRQQSDLKKLAEDGETFILRRGNKAIVMRKVEGSSFKRQKQARVRGDVEKTAKGEAFPIATLVKNVVLKAKLGFQDTIERHLPEYAEDLQNEIVKEI